MLNNIHEWRMMLLPYWLITRRCRAPTSVDARRRASTHADARRNSKKSVRFRFVGRASTHVGVNAEYHFNGFRFRRARVDARWRVRCECSFRRNHLDVVTSANYVCLRTTVDQLPLVTLNSQPFGLLRCGIILLTRLNRCAAYIGPNTELGDSFTLCLIYSRSFTSSITASQWTDDSLLTEWNEIKLTKEPCRHHIWQIIRLRLSHLFALGLFYIFICACNMRTINS